MEKLKVVIPAAGRGKRLGTLTEKEPKPMLRVHGKPLLRYVIENIKRDLGFDEFVIIVGYQGDKIREYFGDGSKLGVSIEYAEQREQKGLAHAILQAKGFVNGNFIVHLADNVFVSPNFREVVKSHLRRKAGSTFLAETVPLEKASNFGVIVAGKNGRITEIAEKPKKPKSSLVATGFYVFNDGIFDAIRRIKPSARGEYEIGDAAMKLAKMGKPAYAVLMQGKRIKLGAYWKDVATSQDLEAVLEKIPSKKLE